MRYSNHKEIKGEPINWYSVITGIFVSVIFLIFPIVFNNFYFDILPTKTIFLCISIFVMSFSLLIYGLTTKKIFNLFVDFNFKNKLKKLSIPDLSIILFLIVAIISTFQSDYLYESFWGNQGRYTGLFMLLLYGLLYFILTRFFKFKQYYLDLFLIGGILVCLFGITDYFKMDLLGFKVNMKPEQYTSYTSTIGNINSYTAYVCMVVAISFILFSTCKKNWKWLFFYYITTVIGFFAIIVGISENTYLSMGALFLFAPLFLFSTRTGFKRYIIMCITFFTTIKVIDIINTIIPERVIGLKGLFSLLSKGNLLYYVIVFFLLVFLVLKITERIRTVNESMRSWLRWAWLGLIIVFFGVILLLIYLYNFTEHLNLPKGDFARYFIFSDSWGTHRGYIWRIAIELYSDFPISRKIFGFGPDTFGVLTTLYKYKEMITEHGVIYESAHNEYLQFLITTGLAGMIFYTTFIFSSLYKLIKRGTKSGAIMAIGFAVLCYSTQAFVNINLPIVTPFMLILLMIGLSDNWDYRK